MFESHWTVSHNATKLSKQKEHFYQLKIIGSLLHILSKIPSSIKLFTYYQGSNVHKKARHINNIDLCL